jgi:hypothetical protein
MKLQFFRTLSLFMEELSAIGKCGQMMEEGHGVFHVM